MFYIFESIIVRIKYGNVCVSILKSNENILLYWKSVVFLTYFLKERVFFSVDFGKNYISCIVRVNENGFFLILYLICFLLDLIIMFN